MAFDKLKSKIPFPLPTPPPELTNSIGQPSSASPPSPGAAPPDFSSILNYKPKRGGLSLDLIASIQKTYADEAAKNNPQTPNAQTPQVGLAPGWGGKGR
jgi:hypothetical protein